MSLMNYRKPALVSSVTFMAALLFAQTATAANQQVKLVPHDTIFYAGTGDPIAVEDIAATSLSATNPELAEKIFPKQEGIDGAQSAIFSFLADYTSDPVAAFEKWGLGDELQFSIFTVGVLPALRLTADAEKFEAAMLEASSDSPARVKLIEHKGIDVKLFLSDDNSAENTTANQDSQTGTPETDEEPGADENAGLVFADADGDVVIALAFDAEDPDYLDQLLGLNDSGQSLEESGKLKQIRDDWNYGDKGVAMYHDYKIFADILTGVSDNSLAAAQVENFAKLDSEIAEKVEQLSSDICKAEITQLASIWPILVGGTRHFEVDDENIQIDAHMAMVTEHQPLLDLFSLMGGFVPQLDPDGNAMLSMGLGIDIDKTPELISQLTGMLGGLNYQCPALQRVNALAQNDLSSAAMGSAMISGMARGIKGISVSIFDSENDDADSTAGSMPYADVLENAAIAIAADDPQTLLSTLSVLPQLESLSNLPMDGTPVPMSQIAPIPLPLNNEVFAAVKDKAIVFYSGDEAQAVSEKLSGIGEEAFFVSRFNMRYFFDNMADTFEQISAQQGQDENLEDVVTLLESYPDGDLFYSIDFTEKGIEIESKFKSTRPE